MKTWKTVNSTQTFSERRKEFRNFYRKELVAIAITNPLTGAFFASSLYSHGERLEINWVPLTIFAVVLLLENISIFWYYRKHPYRREGNSDES